MNLNEEIGYWKGEQEEYEAYMISKEESKPPWITKPKAKKASDFGVDKIKLKYVSVDGYRKSASFKTLKGALNFIDTWVGLNADYSSYGNYMVCNDGVGKVVGMNVCLKDLL